MLKLVAKSLALGFVGLVVAPVVVFFGVLAVGYTFDTRCGTPGDSGGCEMGAATMAIAAAPVGFLVCFIITLVRGLAARSRTAPP